MAFSKQLKEIKMGEKWVWISCAIIISMVSISGATTEIMKARAQTSCIAAYANSTRSIEDIKKLCE